MAFCVTYKRIDVEVSLYATSDKLRDAYKANSFVHWMEGEGVEDIIQRPRQFVVVSKLHQVLPEGIPESGSFYTDNHATLCRAQRFIPTEYTQSEQHTHTHTLNSPGAMRAM